VIRTRRGIALPMVLLVMAALGLLSALGLADAALATRVAALAEDGVRARAAALEALPQSFAPPDPAWLCLQPPHRAVSLDASVGGLGSARIVWWSVAPGEIVALAEGMGRAGGRHRRLALLTPDTLPADGEPGCPDATRLRPAGTSWLLAHPDG